MSRPPSPTLIGLSPTQIINLGKIHLGQFARMGVVDDIDKAVKYLSLALASTPEDHPHFLIVLHALSFAYNDRYERLGALDDLENAIKCELRALALTPGDHPDFPMRLENLGVSYCMRFQRLDELDSLDRGIEYVSKALSLTPDGHPDTVSQLSHLGVAYMERFRRLGQLGDLKTGAKYQARSLALTQEGDLTFPSRLSNLGAIYHRQFQRMGDPGDIDKAIGYNSQAVSLLPSDHPHFPFWLISLGLLYNERFRRLGNLGDLEKAIEHKSRSVALTPSDHAGFPYRLMILGMSYSDRYDRLSELDDLERAIACKSRSVELTPSGHPELPSRLTTLGLSLSARLQCKGNLADLDKAIEYHSRALSLTPDNHPDLLHRYLNLGGQYTGRFRRLHELGDLDKAIEYTNLALSVAPSDHPLLPLVLSNLGECSCIRFTQLGRLDDIENATAHSSRAVALTPKGHPLLPHHHSKLALIHLVRFERIGDPPSIQVSLHSYQNASQSLVGSPKARFFAALEWSNFASVYDSLNPVEAYQTTIDLLPQFIWLGATTGQRYHDLEKAKNLAVRAASVAIQYLKYELAIEWLEHARCVVWNQSLMLRSPLDRLQSSHPDLATRLQTVAGQLRHASSESRASQEPASDMIPLEQAAQEHRRLAQEYIDLLSEARRQDGFEDFLRPIKANRLVRAARNGPIVAINCHADRSDALLIRPGHDQVAHIPLPSFTYEKAQHARSEVEAAVRSNQMRERGERRPVMDEEPADEFANMLAILWYDVVKPVLDYLGYTNNASTEDMPNITWCPTGAASFLPLHAAGDYDQPGSRVFDYVISSYTPTLSALLASTPSSLCPDSRVLAIGQEATPGHTRLPGTTRELAYVQAHIQNKAQYTQLINNQATTIAVLEEMEHHDWVHLACHAHQNVADATRSGFFLHDGTLDLAEINRWSFKSKGLAFLSACQTATGDENLPDEAVHLASGMLMAGYTSVIATMWSVHDADAPVVADRVYAELMRDRKLGNGEAGRALHNAVAELREKVGEKEFGRWVPYIHLGS